MHSVLHPLVGIIYYLAQNQLCLTGDMQVGGCKIYQQISQIIEYMELQEKNQENLKKLTLRNRFFAA